MVASRAHGTTWRQGFRLGAVPAVGSIGDTLSKEFGGLPVPFEEIDLIGFALGHQADVSTETVQLFVAGAFWSGTEANPDHTVLHRVDRESLEGVQFIS